MAPTAATCPCGTDRLIVTGEVASTRSRPAGTDRIAVIAAAGRCERFATVSLRTSPSSRKERRRGPCSDHDGEQGRGRPVRRR